MPTTIDRKTTQERPIREAPPPSGRKPRPDAPAHHRVPRWIQWMAVITFAVLAVGSGLWFSAREVEPTIQEQALDWPACWPLCSAAAEVQAAAPAEAITPTATQAELPDCWPLCSYAANAATITAPAASATSYPDCWPLCAAAARVEQAQPPVCRPLCSYALTP